MSKRYLELSNFFLAVPFIYAILEPEKNIDFIYNTSIMLFIAEFITIHSSAMLSGTPDKELGRKTFLFFFYMAFVFAFSLVSKSKNIFYFLTVSFFIKFFIHKNESNADRIVKPIIVFVSSAFLVTFTSGIWKSLIQIPLPVLMHKQDNISGLFVEIPQTILAWGILYPIGLYFISFMNFKYLEYSQPPSDNLPSNS